MSLIVFVLVAMGFSVLDSLRMLRMRNAPGRTLPPKGRRVSGTALEAKKSKKNMKVVGKQERSMYLKKIWKLKIITFAQKI